MSVRLSITVAMLGLACSACTSNESAQGPACQVLFRCVRQVESSRLAMLAPLYDENSSCWTDEGRAEGCDEECHALLEALSGFHPDVALCQPQSVEPEAVIFAQTPAPAVDLLFVLDSWANASGVHKLLGAFGQLLEGLQDESRGGGAMNLRIGVITSHLGWPPFCATFPNCDEPMGDGALLQHAPLLQDCPAPGDPWIELTDGTTNISGCKSTDALECVQEAFSCIANIYSGGGQLEMPFEATRRALDPTLNLNPGFLRDNAMLAVVMLAEEDDCSVARPELFDSFDWAIDSAYGPPTSFRCFEFGIQCDIGDRRILGPREHCVPAYNWLTQVYDYQRFFEQLKGKHRVVMTAISGPGEPVEVGSDGPNPVLLESCRMASGFAVPALRIEALVKALDGVASDFCADSYGPALRTIGRKIQARSAGRCIAAPLLSPGGGVACAAGVGVCTVPGCPAGTSCDVTKGVCLDTAGAETSSLCGGSCLDKVDCQVEVLDAWPPSGAPSTPLTKCPRTLFDPTIAADSCGESCPCWRIVPRPEECLPDMHVSPFGLEVMRDRPPAAGEVVRAICPWAPFEWRDEAVLDTSSHCR